MEQMQVTLKKLADIATNPKHSRWICWMLIAGDVALCGLIIRRVPYTEIDWKAYMEQVELFLNGERDYIKLRGGTGPLVYPAAHVYIYSLLYYVTDGGRNIVRAQSIFAGLYLFTLSLVMACYRLAKVPPYVFPMLVLSKRLHSIYVLRMFNDCFTVLALFTTIYAFQKRKWIAGSIAYSFGLAIKMSMLLPFPAVAAILLQTVLYKSFYRESLVYGLLIGGIQVFLGLPFLLEAPWSYVSRSFELSRVFLFKWTVNWRFVGEERFLLKPFANGLLIGHIALLFIFALQWLAPSGLGFRQLMLLIRGKTAVGVRSSAIDSDFIITSILTANAIGMLCARSLHYQFYSWLAWTTPFLLYRSGIPPVFQFLIWGAQEWAWNVYPSTNTSSITVVSALAITIVAINLGARFPSGTRPIPRSEKSPSTKAKNR